MTYMEMIQTIRSRSVGGCDYQESIDVFARLQRQGKITRQNIAQDDFELTATDSDINTILSEVKKDSNNRFNGRGF